MKIVKPIAILDYYDGPVVFAACDPTGGHYIGSAIEPKYGYNRYLVTGVRPERLRQYRFGKVDLRTLLLEAPGGEWYITWSNSDPGQLLVLMPQTGPLSATDHLPLDCSILYDETPDIPELKRRIALGKPIAITGQVAVVNRTAGHWKLSTGTGMASGKLAPGASLDGLQIGMAYCLHCVEIVEMDALWRDQRVLYLKSYAPA